MPVNTGYLTAKTDKVSDEYMTPDYAVKPIIKYIPKNAIIWCPFDKDYCSSYVQLLRQAGHIVIASHIDEGQNFFDFEPETYDIIISNPPFSIKDAILARLDELGKPYAMLLPLPTLQGQKRFASLKGTEALIFDKRVNFYSDEAKTKMAKGVAFASIYVCKNFLPEKLIFEELEIED